MSRALSIGGRMVASMPGAYRFAQTRLDVTVTDPDGTQVGQWPVAAVTLRDGQVQVKADGAVVYAEPATQLTRTGRRSWRVTTDAGATLALVRDCGCGG